MTPPKLEDGAPLVRRVYLVRLTRPHAPTERYRGFELVGDELKQLWPPDAHARSKAYRLPFQVFSMREGYDAFHFAFERGGHQSPCERLARALHLHWRCRVEVYDLSGVRFDFFGINANGDERCLTAP